ncbi:hypothetical protein [Atopobium sp. oral taxon 416]|nr:hypothetical protein [Atopobium sp. oral taxon 416]
MDRLVEWLRNTVAQAGDISKEELDQLIVADDIEQAISIATGSQRD